MLTLNIILNACTLALLIVFGIWFRHVNNHILKSKDTSIETLKTAVEAKEAVIQKLQGETAPAIIKDYQTIREYAESKAKEFAELKDKIEKQSKAQHLDQVLSASAKISGEIRGISLASELLRVPLDKFMQQYQKNDNLVDYMTMSGGFLKGILEVFQELNQQTSIRLAQLPISNLAKAIEARSKKEPE